MSVSSSWEVAIIPGNFSNQNYLSSDLLTNWLPHSFLVWKKSNGKRKWGWNNHSNWRSTLFSSQCLLYMTWFICQDPGSFILQVPSLLKTKCAVRVLQRSRIIDLMYITKELQTDWLTQHQLGVWSGHTYTGEAEYQVAWGLSGPHLTLKVWKLSGELLGFTPF